LVLACARALGLSRPVIGLLLSLLAMIPAPALRAQTTVPAWWAQRGVLNGLSSDDNAVVTAQQVYNFALAALLELDAKLAGVGGATTSLSAAAALVGTPQEYPGLHAEYFNNQDFSGVPVLTRPETGVDFDWGAAGSPVSPGPGVDARGFTVRWAGEVVPAETGSYLLEVRHTDYSDSDLWVNGQHVSGPNGRYMVSLTAEQPASFVLRYRASPSIDTPAGIQVRWAQGPDLASSASLWAHASYGTGSFEPLGEEELDLSLGIPHPENASLASYTSLDAAEGILVYGVTFDNLGYILGGWAFDPWIYAMDYGLPLTSDALRVGEPVSGGFSFYQYWGNSPGLWYVGVFPPGDFAAWENMTPIGLTDALGLWRTYDNLSLLNGTVGQLRAFANLLRARLAALGYANLPVIPAGDDADILTVGDLKALFNFDLDSFDYDGDGRTYAEELEDGTDPYDYFNGETPVIVTIEGGDQSGPPGHFLEYPWTVRVKTTDGVPLINAPVTFALAEEEAGFLSVRGDGSTPLVRSIELRTDAAGFAWVYLMP
jgi:hypothetical protein